MLMFQEPYDLELRLARRLQSLRRLLVAADRAAAGLMERHGVTALPSC